MMALHQHLGSNRQGVILTLLITLLGIFGGSAAFQPVSSLSRTVAIPRGGAGERGKSVILSQSSDCMPRKFVSILQEPAPSTTREFAVTTTTATAPESSRKLRIDVQTVSLTGASILIVWLLYRERSVWLPFLDKDKIQQGTLKILRSLQPEGAVAQNALISKPLLLYAGGLAVWELLGLSTIPVETAAGMVFGWSAAIYSIAGKLTGAMTAFSIGRYMLSSQLSRKLANNEVFQLVNAADPSPAKKSEGSHYHPPLMTAFLMKFSCFPEFVKNFGSSLLPVIAPWMFVVATLLHGGTFSILWTWVGVDTARQMEQVSRASSSLHGALIFAAFVGVVVTPAIMAWWIRDLRRLSEERGSSSPMPSPKSKPAL